jgi:hypothetical protein
MPDVVLYVLGYAFAFAAGFVFGKWNGYLDALPKRDESGRFIKKD